ncbi:discoidin domain-containing protein [Streptosporangium sp. NPDC000509]|uniref:discoidin domain-containing protein n=1 Tax=Streptosporangium sp. NPDC000509 TaxID=3366186 RepID=UPI0036779061
MVPSMGFVRPKATGFTAIIPARNDPWEALFLRGGRVAKINQGSLISEGPLLEAYDDQLAGIPELFAGHSDAAFDVRGTAGPRRTIFIAGDECLDWRWGVGAGYEGPIIDLPGFGCHIPDGFRSGLDAVMGLPDGSTMLFNRDQCAIIEWGDQGRCSYEGPLNQMPKWHWLNVPQGMSDDFDHAVMFKTPDRSDEETLLIKGDRAMILHWIIGPRRRGAYTDVVAGLGALPDAYRQPGKTYHRPPLPLKTAPLAKITTDWGNTPDRMVDGDPDTFFWSSSSQKVGDHVTVDLGALHSIGDVRLLMGKPSSPDDYIHAGTLESSADGVTWKQLATGTTAEIRVTAPEGTLARYVRYRATSAGNHRLVVREFTVEANDALYDALWQFLDERRTLTTRHHVVRPGYVPVEISANLALHPDAPPSQTLNDAKQALKDFYDPRTGGPGQAGWPFGRAVYASEASSVLERVPMVDYVEDVQVRVHGTPDAPDRVRTDADGNRVAVVLHADELVRLQATPLVAYDVRGQRYRGQW